MVITAVWLDTGGEAVIRFSLRRDMQDFLSIDLGLFNDAYHAYFKVENYSFRVFEK